MILMQVQVPIAKTAAVKPIMMRLTIPYEMKVISTNMMWNLQSRLEALQVYRPYSCGSNIENKEATSTTVTAGAENPSVSLRHDPRQLALDGPRAAIYS